MIESGGSRGLDFLVGVVETLLVVHRMLWIVLGLLGCSQRTVDINGTYDGTMTRSKGCGDPPPASATAAVQIVDNQSTHAVHILGAQSCDLDFTITDYGGVGSVTAVHPGCAFQPAGMTFGHQSDFWPGHISLTWASGAGDAGGPDGGAACTVIDTWALKHR